MIPSLRQTRETLQQAERQRLAPFAVHSAKSRGRLTDEPEHPYRTCFQRDRDRIIHTAAFRRLDAKTQVFIDWNSDYYRTRLTHTLEVAQIARTLARVLSANEDLAEAAALAHDLGHPPYGHSGEAVLDALMADHGGFEHNRQSLRVVETLEHPYPEFRGLNLSYETLECLGKHETRYDQPEEDNRFGQGQATLEGQIADLADSIAYNSHDLDDALAQGLIIEDDLAEVSLYRQLKEAFEQRYPQAHGYARRLRCAKQLLDLLVSDVLEESARRLTDAAPQDVDAVRDRPGKLIGLSTPRQRQLDELADFLYQRVYLHSQVARAQGQSRAELETLFAAYLQEPSLLPQRYQQRLDAQGTHRVICDYLAGMTDRFCHRLYLEHRP